VIQAVPVVQERLGVANGAPNQVLKVANTPVIADELMPEPGSEPLATFIVEVQNRAGGWDVWTRVDSLYAAGPDDTVYQLDPESGLVSFGDGLRGSRPQAGRVVRVSYEYGGGLQGRVPIGAITKAPALPGGFKISNPVATWGASQGETVADGERNISRFLRHRDRLVTLNDFDDIARRTPGVDIGRVEALSMFNPDTFAPGQPYTPWPGAVTVMVVPRYSADQTEPPRPDRLFLNAVCTYLEPRRLATTEIFVRGPEYVPIWVTVGITTVAGQQRYKVAQVVQQAIRDYLSPLIGGPAVRGASSTEAACSDDAALGDPCVSEHGTGWALGMEVRRQDLEAVAVRVEGVRYVNSLVMGVLSATGTDLIDVATQPIAGIQLPWLAGISVREGAAEDLDIFGGADPAEPGNSIPVPVLRKTCC
jgi:predicted phage baseplate assembly protein